MQEEQAIKEIESYIKKQEIEVRSRVLEENYNTLNNFWNIGRVIMEYQNGEARAKYGNELIKKCSNIFTLKYGKGYDASNLSRFRQFYLTFPILGTACQLSWSIIRKILPIKESNKRNYYINLCIEQNLSVRELVKEIKSSSYERLIDKPEHIEIMPPRREFSLTTNMKNPIIIELKDNEQIISESDLELKIISELNLFFKQLGNYFAFVGNQYKITKNNKDYHIDILLFNIKANCYVVVELKVRELQKEDKAQIEFYMNLVDEQIKESFHNKTTGIIITKKQDKFIANFVRSNDIIPLTYEIK